jgi:DNA-binding CsgD family transcriptional regulator
MLCLYFMGLNLSNRQIAQALGLNPGDVRQLTDQLRTGVVTAQRVCEKGGGVVS